MAFSEYAGFRGGEDLDTGCMSSRASERRTKIAPFGAEDLGDVNGDGASRGFEKLGCARMGGRRLGASRSESCWTATVDEERARRRSMGELCGAGEESGEDSATVCDFIGAS